MSDAAPREWRFYLDDMIDFAEKVIVYTDGLDQEAFVASGLNYDATVRNLELIGEAATHILEGLRAANPQIPWRPGHRDAQPADPRLLGNRQRHLVECCPGRDSSLARNVGGAES